MPRKTFHVVVAISVLLYADCSRDDDSGAHRAREGDVTLLVGSRSLQKVRTKQQASSLVDATASTADSEQFMTNAVAGIVHAATEDMVVVRNNARELLKAVESLGLDVGHNENSSMAKVKANAEAKQSAEQAKAKASAKQKLREVAAERQNLVVQADALESRLQDIYKNVVGIENVEADFEGPKIKEYPEEQDKGSPEKSKEDKEFDKLEKATDHLMSWFSQLKSLSQQRDSANAKQEKATQTAQDSVLSQGEIADQLKRAKDSNMDKAESQQTSSLVELSSQQQLSQVVTGSRLDMQRVAQAATDVMNSLAEVDEWKKRSDELQSAEEGLALKDKLKSSIQVLQQNEESLSERTDQIKAQLNVASTFS